MGVADVADNANNGLLDEGVEIKLPTGRIKIPDPLLDPGDIAPIERLSEKSKTWNKSMLT